MAVPWLGVPYGFPPACFGLPIYLSLSPASTHRAKIESHGPGAGKGLLTSRVRVSRGCLFARCRDTDVHTVASLFKLYLRELPEPVVPWMQYEDFLLCGQALDADEKKVEMHSFLSFWPSAVFQCRGFVSWRCWVHMERVITRCVITELRNLGGGGK